MHMTIWRATALSSKAALAALLALALLFPHWDRFADKAMGTRAVAYPAAALLVALVWALRGRRGAYPWDVDALLTAPFLIDVAGNAADLYDAVGWFDDACHFGNWALLTAAAGVALRRWSALPPWALALACAGIGAITAILWEFAEFALFILDTPETTTIYRDTVGDLMLGLTGSTAAGLVVALRNRTRGKIEKCRHPSRDVAIVRTARVFDTTGAPFVKGR
ncbi:hypothetical protein [Actinomadura parmotrematis]|uniref:VanZ family protein n=1 Tax=Actinomadura parmotrematis TaxID=2864039 RepID=A0ABS7G310_9ACTN|nr:hypothetical protein [Actinomadura parmotrematis]MBW8486585.1 hypothetical protein [Actinomadura parmotrematis]